MFHFTIRDVLWLTVVVGLVVGWWREREHLQRVAEAKAALEKDVRDIWREHDPFDSLNPVGKLEEIRKKYFPKETRYLP